MSEQLRIVSLIASATEIVCALGLRDRLVGRSHECDYPSSVLSLPQCTGPKFATAGTSAEIDARVKTILEQSLSVYSVDSQLLDRLAPSHIITQSQCEVCAVSLRDVEQAVCKLIRSRPSIVELRPDNLSDVWHDIQTVAAALAVEERGRQLVNDLHSRLQALRLRRAQITKSPRLAFIEWIDPLMAGGNWMPELIEAAGAENIFGEVGKHAPPIRFAELVSANPDIIVVAPCGFDLPRTLEELPSLEKQAGWRELAAVKSGSVFVADGNQFFNRPGPRLLDSAEILADIIDATAGEAKASEWWLRISKT